MLWGAGSGNVASYNLVHDSGTATTRGEGIEADTNSNGVFLLYNVIYGCTNGGIGLTGTGHHVYGNTTYNNNTRGYDAGELQIWGSGSNMTVKNNIFYASSGKHLLVAGFGNITGHTVDHNIWYGGSPLPFQWAMTNYNFAGYQRQSGQDASSTDADPKFKDSLAGNFILQPGSPAIGSGIYIPGVTTTNPTSIGAK